MLRLRATSVKKSRTSLTKTKILEMIRGGRFAARRYQGHHTVCDFLLSCQTVRNIAYTCQAVRDFGHLYHIVRDLLHGYGGLRVGSEQECAVCLKLKLASAYGHRLRYQGLWVYVNFCSRAKLYVIYRTPARQYVTFGTYTT